MLARYSTSLFRSCTSGKCGMSVTHNLRMKPRAAGARLAGTARASAAMRVVPVEVLGDSKNYAYLLIDDSVGKAAAVDPAEPAKLLDAANREGVEVDTILTTHKHWDHAGGNNKFKKVSPGVEVIGGVNDHVEGATRTVQDGDEFDWHGIHIKCIETPFHTMGHICFLCKAPGAEDLIFTGDTLFVAGCGRNFEGKPQNMYNSLIGKLKGLPPKTQVYCGHNYTRSNLAFAQHVDPDNAAIKQKIAWTEERDNKGLPTIPSSIGEENLINPFLRPDDPVMKKFTQKSDPLEVLAALRSSKDRFKG